MLTTNGESRNIKDKENKIMVNARYIWSKQDNDHKILLNYQ